MSIAIYRLLTIFAAYLFVAVAIYPITTFSAEENVVISDPVSDLGSTPPSVSPTPLPYKTEQLLGDEVVGDFVVGPGKMEITVLPGQTKTVEITVSNRTGALRTFELSTEDAVGSSDPSQTLVLLGDDRGPYSMKDYVQFIAPRFELPHNERARIPVTISVPANAEPGGLYGSVLVSTVSQEAKLGDEAGTAPQSAVVARIGTLFFITIPGEITRSGELKDFGTVAKQKFFQSGPIPMGILFENTGGIHLAPYGEIRIHNMIGEEVGMIQLEPWFILPGSTRLREVQWTRDFLFGRYVATAHINRSYDDVVDTMSFTFYVLPWKMVLAAFTAIFIVFFFIRAFFRKFEFKRKE